MRARVQCEADSLRMAVSCLIQFHTKHRTRTESERNSRPPNWWNATDFGQRKMSTKVLNVYRWQSRPCSYLHNKWSPLSPPWSSDAKSFRKVAHYVDVDAKCGTNTIASNTKDTKLGWKRINCEHKSKSARTQVVDNRLCINNFFGYLWFSTSTKWQ